MMENNKYRLRDKFFIVSTEFVNCEKCKNLIYKEFKVYDAKITEIHMELKKDEILDISYGLKTTDGIYRFSENEITNPKPLFTSGRGVYIFPTLHEAQERCDKLNNLSEKFGEQ